MNTSSNSERIESYLFNRMSPELKVQFETDLKSDQDLAREFNETKEMLKLAQLYQKAEQHEAYLSLIEEAENKESRRKWRNGLSIAAIGAIAATILLLIVFGQNKTMLDQYFVPFPEETMMGTPADSSMVLGMEAYGHADYTQALASFAHVPSSDKSYPRALFFTANSYIALGDLKPAKAVLIELQTFDLYKDEKRWLLGLLLIDLGEKAKGEASLKDLLEDPQTNFKQDEIRQILSQ